MSRLHLAAQLVEKSGARSVLDVGCREGALADLLPSAVEYAGADLFPDARGRVTYVGDISDLRVDRKFDAVVALDILEHLEAPSSVFDRLISLAGTRLIVSLPNCYDLKSRFGFAVRGKLGNKYDVGVENPVDRHRWLMNRSEIEAFYVAKAHEHNSALRIIDLRYGDSGRSTATARAGRVASHVLPRSLTAETVIGEFGVR